MADYSDLATSAAAAIEAGADGGFVEEYQHRNLRVRRGRVVEQVQAIATLNGLAARASGGVCRLAKFQEPQS